MSVKFIFEEMDDEPLHFSDVEENQFFIAHTGHLCQKVNAHAFNFLSRLDGTPHAGSIDTQDSTDFRIKKILDKVVKIEF